MPAKVQLKLLSNSGELLNVANCCAGKISVLRASTPSDLRPYQRALGGSTAKDNLEILCDGTTFHPEEHTLIGFGEPSPTTGRSVREFLTTHGISELAIATQLMSIGLDDVLEKKCSELTLDQESRLRLLAATADPDKVLVLNDPFENISAKWRERTAEILAEFARARNAIVIIPSLSYRPEAWIENNCIERIEVGQTAQRTIGFGSAGSQSNSAMDDIRNQLRADPRFAGQVGGQDPRAIAAMAAAGLAPGIGPEELGVAGAKTASHGSTLATLSKMFLAVVGTTAGGWAVYTFTMAPPKDPQAPPAVNNVAMVTNPKMEGKARDNAQAPSQLDAPPADNQAPAQVAAVNVIRNVPPQPSVQYLLDLYPVDVKTSLLETARGSISFPDTNEAGPVEPIPAQKNDSGNLFSLLEAASNSKPEPGDANSYASNYNASRDDSNDRDDSEAPSAEDAQREAIRNRFLEAIRASAARRQAEAEEDY